MPRRVRQPTNGQGDEDGDNVVNMEAAEPKRGRGRPRKAVPDSAGYTSSMYEEHLRRMDDAHGELAEAQAEIRQTRKAATDQGLLRKADDFVRGLRAQIRNDKLALRDAQAIVEAVQTYWDWTGLPLDLAAEQRGRQAEMEVEPAI